MELEARTQHLIRTAAALFIAKGFRNVSLAMIARQARVATRTIYVKFGDKAGLLSAVISAECVGFRSGLELMLADQRPAHEALEDFAFHFLELIKRDSFLAIERMALAEAALNPDLGETYYRNGQAVLHEYLTAYFARPEIRCLFRKDISCARLSTHLIACLTENIAYRHLGYREPDQGAHSTTEALSLFFQATLQYPA